MPHEMNDLFERLWIRVRENDQLYGIDADTFIHVAHAVPWKVSLLELTLADDESLIPHLLALKTDKSALPTIKQACDRMKRRLFASTAGLVELRPHIAYSVLASRWGESLPLLISREENVEPRYPICGCGDEHRSNWKFHLKNRTFIIDYQWRSLQFIHRSAVEFLISKNSSTTDVRSHKDLYRKLFSVLLVICACGLLIRSENIEEILYGLGKVLGRDDTNLILPGSIEDTLALLKMENFPGCEYGWFHDNISDYLRRVTPALDLAGLTSELGFSSPITAMTEHLNQEPSSYYKGYLVTCAAFQFPHGDKADEKEYLIAKAEIILKLIKTGADMHTPQLRFMSQTHAIIQPRPPLIDSWFLILQALIIWDNENCPWPQVFQEISVVLDRYEFGGSEKIVCSIGTYGHGTDISITSSRSEDYRMIIITAVSFGVLRNLVRRGLERYVAPHSLRR